MGKRHLKKHENTTQCIIHCRFVTVGQLETEKMTIFETYNINGLKAATHHTPIR